MKQKTTTNTYTTTNPRLQPLTQQQKISASNTNISAPCPLMHNIQKQHWWAPTTHLVIITISVTKY